MTFEPGREKTGGRKKGVQNKSTRAVRDALIGAFERAGGEGYLLELATNDPRTFSSLISRLIPTESKLTADVPIIAIRNYTGREFEDAEDAEGSEDNSAEAASDDTEGDDDPESLADA